MFPLITGCHRQFSICHWIETYQSHLNDFLTYFILLHQSHEWFPHMYSYISHTWLTSSHVLSFISHTWLISSGVPSFISHTWMISSHDCFILHQSHLNNFILHQSFLNGFLTCFILHQSHLNDFLTYSLLLLYSG